MKRDLATLENQTFDLIVVGGGIFGICAAWDATLRGLSVALLEQGDFGHSTSANHFKVVHGGIRYLQHADIPRIRESSRERTAFLRIAPHLVQPMPFVIPTYGHGIKGREAMRMALALYDLFTYDRNQGINDPERQVPRGKTISRAALREMFPHLNPQGVTGAAIFHDGQMYNPPRLSLSFVKAAAARGAVVANYTRVTDFVRHNGRIVGVRACDLLEQKEIEVRGKVVVNAAGPWAKWLLDEGAHLTLKREPTFSRDAYFVVGKKLVDTHALSVQGQTRDPDALLSRGNRHLFMVPWRDYTLIGVWHIVHTGRPETFTVTEEDLNEFLTEFNASYPAAGLTLDDVTTWNAGLTLFGENEPGATHLSYGKRSIVVDHAQDHGLEGLLTVIGVRFTTARGIAEQVIDRVFEKLERPMPPSTTAETPIYGGDFDTFKGLVGQVKQQAPEPVCDQTCLALAHNHGSAFGEILSYVAKDAHLGARVGASPVLAAEVVHAVHAEMAHTLSDIIFRRTDLGTGGRPDAAALEMCGRLMAAELGWDEARLQRELSDVNAAFPHFGK